MGLTNAVATHCPFCALQCGMHVATGTSPANHVNPVITVLADPRFPVNKGGLCVKGWASAATLAHPGRLLTPLIRNGNGQLEPATWDAALAEIATRFRDVQARMGRDGIAVLGGGPLTNEKAYLLGKFARAWRSERRKVLEDVPCDELPAVRERLIPYVGGKRPASAAAAVAAAPASPLSANPVSAA